MKSILGLPLEDALQALLPNTPAVVYTKAPGRGCVQREEERLTPRVVKQQGDTLTVAYFQDSKPKE